ncbi:P-loop containing nucleoside triphosphate hydrolase protein [Cercophora newfieldiana]|uniref:P-loop containing nucleoside triphosphate hydrolase protein n=1 Tax=Cercophora newfieldiana TaxID=92897 RepID=A0AA39XV95_9PEZI|nr:P-loop containing nucleoside triphosphate hydrolase protein [Cercophora newfieldiana]
MYPTLRALSVAFSASFVAWLPFRFSQLRTEATKVISRHGGHVKLRIAILLALVQSTVLFWDAFSRFGADRFFSAIPSVLACIGLCPLLFYEHTKSTRPSDLAVLYLLLTLVPDSVDLGARIHDDGISVGVGLAAASALLKLVLVVIESRGKASILRDERSPEESSGVLSRIFFWWINPILAKGNRNILTGEELPPMGQKLSSELRRQKALQAWDRRAKPEGKMTLPMVLVRSMLPHFLAPIIPRLSLIVFRYSQPVLISTAIRTISKGSSRSTSADYWVVLMAVVVYVGLAVSTALFKHRINRLEVMIRGAVVGLINNKSLSHHSSHYDDGQAVTLMSTDADNVARAASMFHGAWAQAVEVVLGMTMLAREVGWIWPVPLVIIFFCSRMSRYLAKNLQGRQKDWTVATQERLAMTISMLGSMKSLKMLGITPYTETLVQNLRASELSKAMKVRWMMVAYNASANALGIFSPILTFVLYVIVASWNGTALDTETAFTTTALLGLVTHPANMIMTIIPQAIGSLAAFQRIQEYLLQPPRNDQRLDLKQVLINPANTSPAIQVENVTIQPATSASPVLKNISFVVNRGSIVTCAGPVGSGKTLLAKALLGELPPTSGTISVASRRIACCEQSPWLPSGTIREAICGFGRDDPGWYREVIRLCCLGEDLSALPNGDQTLIGSRGLNLSGGQRQRVALARAVYARFQLVLLDDCFSALDGTTEKQIIENLLGPEGLFRNTGTTVFLISNSALHFRLADWLVILGDSEIRYQGTWKNLREDADAKQVLKLDINSEGQNGSAEKQPELDKTVQSQSLKLAEATDDLSRATGDASLYGYYLRAVGARNFFILLSCTFSYSFFVTFPQYWLQKWTEAPVSQTWFYVGGYLILSFLAWAATNGSMWSTHILIAPSSGLELHRRLLSTVIGRAPLLYFSTTDTGVILNRFSQDMRLVDRQLPPAVLAISNQIFKLLVQCVLLFSAQKLMTLTLPICVATVYFVQKIYLRTSRQLRLLDLESQSAVYSSFLESVEGVTTIRAFGWEKQAEQANIRALDKSQKPDYILFCLQQWLGIVLDLMVAAIATGLIALALFLKGTTTAGQIGMALNIVLVANSTLLSLVTSWTNMEISLGAISRLKSLETKTPREDKPDENHTPTGPWPSSGALEFDNVTVAYKQVFSHESIALQNVTLSISAGQQVAVCGRTGSGKSTMLLTLLRLIDVKSGTIKVDGVDLSLVPRSLIRQRCFITVGQEALVLSQASLRFNLDPSASLSDSTIIAALERTNLWRHFSAGSSSAAADPQKPIEASDILDTAIASLPHMSTGQSQLFAVARAILQLQSIRITDKNRPEEPYRDNGTAIAPRQSMPILLLDEATSSLDPESEAAIHTIIREEFTDKGHTVIAITHRLGGLATEKDVSDPKRDVVVLLSRGRVEKFGPVQDILTTQAESSQG